MHSGNAKFLASSIYGTYSAHTNPAQIFSLPAQNICTFLQSVYAQKNNLRTESLCLFIQTWNNFGKIFRKNGNCFSDRIRAHGGLVSLKNPDQIIACCCSLKGIVLPTYLCVHSCLEYLWK